MTPQLKIQEGRKKENEATKDRIIKDIRNLFQHEEKENYYKPVRVANFWSSNYIEYENNGDRNILRKLRCRIS